MLLSELPVIAYREIKYRKVASELNINRGD